MDHPTPRLLLGSLLAALLVVGMASSAAASDFTVTKATVKFSPKKGDAFALNGTFADLALTGVDAIRLDVGNFSQAIPLAAFTSSKGKLVFKAPKGSVGLVQVVVDTVKQTLGAKAKGLASGNFPDPAPLRLVAGSFDGCTMIALTAKRTKAGSYSALSFGKKSRQFACVIVAAPIADPDALFVDTPTDVRVRAHVGSDPSVGASNVTLWRVDAALNPVAPLGTLVDDGNLGEGDDIAADGVFSIFQSFSEAAPGAIFLEVSADVVVGGVAQTVWLPVVALSVVAKLSSPQIAAIQAAQDAASAFFDANIAELGDTLKARKKTAKQIKALDGVRDAGVSSDGVTIWIEYEGGPRAALLTPQSATNVATVGTTMAISAARAAVASAATADDAKAVGNNRILVWDSLADEYPEYGSMLSHLKPIFDASTCPLFQVSHVENTACTVASVKNFSGYGTVIITGHGGVMKGDIVIATRQEISWSEWWNKSPSDSRLAITPVKGTKYLGITPAYVASLQFPRSVIINTACHGFDNPGMQAAFFGAGAAAYFAYKGQGLYNFSETIAQQLMQSMVANKKNTGDAYAALTITQLPFLPGGFLGGGFFTLSDEGRDLAYTGRFRNGDFETGDLTGWLREGDAQVVTSLGNLDPKAGSRAGLVTTGLGFVTQPGTIYQSFCLPEKATTLEYDWAFSSEEFKEYCGSQFQDTFRVSITDDADVQDLQITTIDQVCGEVVPSTIELDKSGDSCTPTDGVGVGTGGNDCKVWTTGWKHQSVSLAALAASNAGKGVTLTLSATDVGDSSYDSAILLDNIEIKTAP